MLKLTVVLDYLALLTITTNKSTVLSAQSKQQQHVKYRARKRFVYFSKVTCNFMAKKLVESMAPGPFSVRIRKRGIR